VAILLGIVALAAARHPRRRLAARTGPGASPSRRAHLLIAAPTAVLIYAPTIGADTSRTILRLVVVPALALTGMVLWKLGPIRRKLHGRTAVWVP
jgi:hypothetical protein